MSPALFAHGAGSSPAFIRQAFGERPGGGGAVLSWWLAGHGRRRPAPDGGAGADLADLDRLARATGARVVGGVSYGAHLAARWAAGLPGGGARLLDQLVLVMPAWTGPPDGAGPAAATAAAAESIARVGIAAATAQAAAGAAPWVAAAIGAAWPLHEPVGLVAALLAIAESAGPTLAELSTIRVPVTLVVNEDDPLHPAAVATAWAAALRAPRLIRVAPASAAELGQASRSASPPMSW